MKPLWVRKIWDEFSSRYPRLACELNFLRRYERFEPDLWLIPRFCRPDAAAVDVGANMGIFSRWMGKHAGRVHAFECNPALFPHLQLMLPANAALHQCALSNQSGRAVLRFDPANTGVGTIEKSNSLSENPGIRRVDAVEVEVSRLDDLGLPAVSFIKIDVEGHELEVLKGARGLLLRDHPALLIEIEERHCPGNLKLVPAWLGEIGYQVYVRSANNSLEKPCPSDPSNGGRVNNFWFVSGPLLNQ